MRIMDCVILEEMILPTNMFFIEMALILALSVMFLAHLSFFHKPGPWGKP
jgi:hypothetical protein